MGAVADPKIWGEFGLGGLVIMALFICLYYLTRQAREERKEWLSAYISSQEMHDKRQSETNLILSDLNTIIQSKLKENWNGVDRRK
jgi:hypothetical protein